MKKLLLISCLLGALLALSGCGDSTPGPGDSDPDGDATLPADCHSGDLLCSGTLLMACNGKSQWMELDDCKSQGKVCTNGACKTASTGCTPGDLGCQGTVLRLCNVFGQWEAKEDCADQGTICSNGACAGQGTGCSPGDVKCVGSLAEACSVFGQWEVQKDCANEGKSCSNGACTSQGTGCNPGEVGCQGSVLRLCNVFGQWEAQKDCADEGKSCSNGACASQGTGCTTGELKCSGDLVKKCNASGEWETYTDCASSSKHCSNGKCQAASDPCSSDYVCSTHHRVCTNVNGKATCGDCLAGYHESSGYCYENEACTATTCSGHGRCSVVNGETSCACDSGYSGSDCSRVCEMGQLTCSGDNLMYCDYYGKWTLSTNCSVNGQGHCVDKACVACTTEDNLKRCYSDHYRGQCNSTHQWVQGVICPDDAPVCYHGECRAYDPVNCAPDHCYGAAYDNPFCNFGSFDFGNQYCDCADGYYWDGTRCTSTNPCSKLDCTYGHRKACLVDDDSFDAPTGIPYCTCDSGYYWNGQDCTTTNPCASAPCNGNYENNCQLFPGTHNGYICDCTQNKWNYLTDACDITYVPYPY